MNFKQQRRTMKKTVVLHFLLITNILCNAEIREINSIKEAVTILDIADEQTLVAFDLDDTLIEFTNKVRQTRFKNTSFIKEYNARLDALIQAKSKNDPLYFFHYDGKIWRDLPSKFVESETPNIVHKLQTRGVKVMGLSAQKTGPHDLIANFEAQRYERLRMMGIDLNQSFVQQHIIFDTFKPFNNYYPAFYKGLLCSVQQGGNSKGEVLGAFLDAIHFKPKQVIFFDDYKYNVDSVEQEMRSRNIPCTCFWYHGALQPDGEIDRAIAEFEFDYLKEHDEFISDEQAAELIKSQNQNLKLQTKSYKL